MLNFIVKFEGAFGNPNISDKDKQLITGWNIINDEDQRIGSIEKGLTGLYLRSNEDLSVSDIITILGFIKKEVDFNG